VVKVPEGVDSDLACAAMVQGITAHFLVKDSYAVKPGDRVLVHAAAGGLGKAIAQIAKIHGAAQVIGTTSSEEKAKIARAHGCDDVILYTQQDFLAETRRLTNQKGVNVVYDSVRPLCRILVTFIGWKRYL
jgi:NADPH2:quinone reductase